MEPPLGDGQPGVRYWSPCWAVPSRHHVDRATASTLSGDAGEHAAGSTTTRPATMAPVWQHLRTPATSRTSCTATARTPPAHQPRNRRSSESGTLTFWQLALFCAAERRTASTSAPTAWCCRPAPPFSATRVAALGTGARGLRYQAGALRRRLTESPSPRPTCRSTRPSPPRASRSSPGRPLLDDSQALCSRIQHRVTVARPPAPRSTRPRAGRSHRQGVCQDFAHIMTGCLRSLGLAGALRWLPADAAATGPAAPDRRRDASHAWVSVWCEAAGTTSIRPTTAARQPEPGRGTTSRSRSGATSATSRRCAGDPGRRRASLQVEVTVAPPDEYARPDPPAD